METTNKKECPKCKSKKIFEVGSGVGSDKGDGSYEFKPFSEIFYECKDCYERFSYKKTE